MQIQKKKKTPITAIIFNLQNETLQYCQIHMAERSKKKKALWIIHFPFTLYQYTHHRILNLKTENTCNSIHLCHSHL